LSFQPLWIVSDPPDWSSKEASGNRNCVGANENDALQGTVRDRKFAGRWYQADRLGLNGARVVRGQARDQRRKRSLRDESELHVATQRGRCAQVLRCACRDRESEHWVDERSAPQGIRCVGGVLDGHIAWRRGYSSVLAHELRIARGAACLG